MLPDLVISPHADDLEIGCGGYVASRVDNGVPVVSVVMGVSTYVRPDGSTVEELQRLEELDAASEVLGYTVPYVSRRSVENQFWTSLVTGPTVHYLRSMIEELKPGRVLVPLPTYDPDHQMVYKLAIAALRYKDRMWNPLTVYGYGPPGVVIPEIGEVLVPLTERQHFRRLEAMRKFKSQDLDKPGLHSVDTVDLRARYNGARCGRRFAEQLVLIREVQSWSDEE